MKYLSILSLILAATSALADIPEATKQFIQPKNIITSNPGYENGKAGWTTAGGSIATTNTAANVGEGQFAASWTATAGSQTHTGTQFTVPSGLYGRACLAKVLYKGGDANLKLQVIDGSSNVLGEQVLSAASTHKEEYVTFICPSSGTVAPRLASTGAAAVIYPDSWFIGENYRVGTVAQSTLYGGAIWPSTASCAWTESTSTWGNFSADTDCTTPAGSNLFGQAEAPATKVPAVKFSNLPPGEYLVLSSFIAFDDTANGEECFYRLSDGTTASAADGQFVSGQAIRNGMSLIGRFKYTAAQSTVTFQVQTRTPNTPNTCSVNASQDGNNLQFLVYRYPSYAETAFRPEVDSWLVDATIGGSFPVSVGSPGSYTEITNAGLTLTNNSVGNLTAQIACASGTASTGTTCSSNESLGVAFNLPKTGKIEVCSTFTPALGTVGDVNAFRYYTIGETTNTSSTILTQGFGVEMRTASQTGGDSQGGYPTHLCSMFDMASVGQKTFRLFVKGSGGISAQIDDGVHWSIRPVTQNVPMPVIVGSVANPSAGQVQLVSATLANSAGTSNCTITRQDGSWISSVTEGTEGECVLNFTSGTFGSGVTPSCVANPITSGNSPMLNIMAQSSSSVTTRCNNPDAPFSACNYPHNIICVGTK